MKDMIVEKKKELAATGGLDPDTIKVSVSSQWAKVRMVVTAAEGDFSFSTKKLLTKTAARYRSEHSVMSGYSYALTALMTHYFTGPQPAWMSDLSLDKLSASTKETIEIGEGSFLRGGGLPREPKPRAID